MRTVSPLANKVEIVGHAWNGTSGNYDKNRGPIKYIILHSMDGTTAGSTAWFKKVNQSANYGVSLNGDITLWIPEDCVAYQAGQYSVNRESLGIEHEDNRNADDKVRTEALYISSSKLVADIAREYNIPLDRAHIFKHSDIVSTHCPGGLDIDKIISMAEALLTQQPQTEPLPETMSDDEVRAVSVLKEAMTRLKTKDGQAFGNIEGMTRELVGTYPVYQDLIKPDTSGNPPVVITHDHFIDVNIKAQNFDKVAAYFGYGEINEVDPSLGDKIVDTIKLFNSKSTNVPDTSAPKDTNVLENIIDPSGKTAPKLPNGEMASVTLTGSPNFISSFLLKLSQVYSSLFVPKEVSNP